uniref:Uncharacterized protein n=1 Tax=Tetranychus urticae TaxID=32264 RepID=T1JQ60_TETUR
MILYTFDNSGDGAKDPHEKDKNLWRSENKSWTILMIGSLRLLSILVPRALKLAKRRDEKH